MIRRWVRDHDGADPTPRTIARLQRLAVLRSRPLKGPGVEGDVLRAEWLDQARGIGFDKRIGRRTAVNRLDRLDSGIVDRTCVRHPG